MSRLDDRLLDIVVYLYETKEDAEAGERYGGTGFLVVVPTGGDKGLCYIVTCDHVAKSNPWPRLSAQGQSTWIPDQPITNWTGHPDGDDIAVASFAIPDQARAEFRQLNWNEAITESEIATFHVGVGDDVAMIGRYMDRQGTQRNTPTARFGRIAMMPGEPVVLESGQSVEAFMVELHVLPGFSGSPVFLSVMPGDWRGHGVAPEPNIGHMPLLGISTALYPWTEAVHHVDTGETKDLFVKGHSGMAVVSPAWRIAGALQEDLRKHGLSVT